VPEQNNQIRATVMKYLLFITLVASYYICIGQVNNAPNETKNGIKQGLWNERDILDSMTIDGHLVPFVGYHHDLVYGVAEGSYVNGKMTGVWKYFWNEYHKSHLNGPLKGIVEYDDGYRNGLFVSYFKSGAFGC
jgi:hypothetical protein